MGIGNKHYGAPRGIHKASEGLNSQMKRKAEKKAEKAMAEKEAQRVRDIPRIQQQRDRWVRWQAYASNRWIYQRIRLWIEFQDALGYTGFPVEAYKEDWARFRCPHMELATVWSEFEVKRREIGKELGKNHDEFFADQDWPGFQARRTRWRHGWKWWLALSRLDEDLHEAFFSEHVIAFDLAGYPVFKSMTEDEAFRQNLPDLSDPHVLEQWHAFRQEQQRLTEAQALARKALQDELEMMEGFKQLDLSVPGAMDAWSSSQ